MLDNRWAEVRHQYGDVYITTFPDGRIVPWKTLSIGDFIYYDQQITRCVMPPAVLEDEVFRKCVQDQSVIDGIYDTPAGVITTVVQNIWEYSGPSTPEKLQSDFEEARSIMKGTRASLIHECANMIATGFNYTLEQVYEMNYETFLLRLAQAESKMLTMGAIQEPFTFHTNQEGPTFADLNKKDKPRVKVDAREAWERQQAARTPKVPEVVKPDQRGKWWEVSPVLESQKRKSINFTIEKQAAEDMVLDNHERNEKGAMRKHIIEAKLAGPRAKMIDDAKIIYKDLIEALEKSRK
jgi:hypothetical protein